MDPQNAFTCSTNCIEEVVQTKTKTSARNKNHKFFLLPRKMFASSTNFSASFVDETMTETKSSAKCNFNVRMNVNGE